MKRILKDFVVKDWEKIKAYCADQKMYHAKFIPYSYINKRLSSMASFKRDRRGATEAIKKTIQTLIDIEYISPIQKSELVKYNTAQKTYMITNMSLIDE